MMNDIDKQRLRKQFEEENLVRPYNEFIKQAQSGLTAGIDNAEYSTFVQMTLKRDVDNLITAYMQGVFNFGEFWNKMQIIVGFDLVIQQTVINAVKVKSNGEDTDE